MSRIFRGSNPIDCQDLLALLKINPEIRLDMRDENTEKIWFDRGHNYRYKDPITNEYNIRGAAAGLEYRVKEDRS